MPAYYTHFVYGIQAYKKAHLGELRDVIERHKHAYAFGLAGPDFFLFSVSDIIKKRKNIGSVMHKERADLFLKNMYGETMKRTGEERETGLAYFCGFLCHYCLDHSCHPFVYRVAERGDKRRSLGAHFALEGAMDVFAAGAAGKKEFPVFTPHNAVLLTPKERAVIANILFHALGSTYPLRKTEEKYIAYRLIQYGLTMRFLADPSGKKERAVKFLEKRILGFAWFSPLFINTNTYGCGEKAWTLFQKRLQAGVKEAGLLLRETERTYLSNTDEEERE